MSRMSRATSARSWVTTSRVPTMKWISPERGLGMWTTTVSFDDTGRTVASAFADVDFDLVAAPACVSNIVGATATMPTAAAPLRAVFKKFLREISAIGTPLSRTRFVKFCGGHSQWRNESLYG